MKKRRNLENKKYPFVQARRSAEGAVNPHNSEVPKTQKDKNKLLERNGQKNFLEFLTINTTS